MDEKIKEIIKRALEEDIGSEDITTEAIIPPGATVHGKIVVKGKGVIAGLVVAKEVFWQIDNEALFEQLFNEGDKVQKGDVVATVSGNARSILMAERTAINFLQRMSSIATTTRQYVDAVVHTKAKILDTRKTAPGLRLTDKMAVKMGGGQNHRIGLYDMFLIKDNDIAVVGSINKAVSLCKRYREEKKQKFLIEVEADTLAQVKEAVESGVDRIMLDNFSVSHMRKAVELINGRTKIEASGGITLENVKEVAETRVDYISVGALTHSVKALDISVDITL
ncbi:MAG: carboxylating nicotinate-nucleotide diphosphorylase [Candidatus Levybacteria bacterium]|nr:carboxylating nicotinate-nucleotide diphosphorylase [Candidatus Levybacteria bacterium]